MYHSSVAENLIFGSSMESRFSEEKLPGNEVFDRFLRQEELLVPLTELGARFAVRILDIFGNLSILPGNIPFTREEMEPLEQALKKAAEQHPSNLAARHRRRLLGSALRYIPAVHKLVDMPESLCRRIVTGRKTLIKTLKEEMGTYEELMGKKGLLYRLAHKRS